MDFSGYFILKIRLMSSWIKLDRGLRNKAFYSKDSEKVHLWIHLLIRANFSEREEMLGGKPILCKSGQFTTGRKQLSTETGICESKIERILTYFEKIEQQIEQQKTSVNRLISITNWHLYQQSEQQFEQRVNNDRTTSEQRVNNDRTHYKKEKNIKKENKDKNIEEEITPEVVKQTIKDREKLFVEQLNTFSEKYDSSTLNSFFVYWAEKTQDGKKMKFELQDTFEISKRLITWKRNETKFNSNNNGTAKFTNKQSLEEDRRAGKERIVQTLLAE